MASNGLLNRAMKGTCRMCLRVRLTDTQVKAVGEVRHGFATGYVWECIDIEDCDKTIEEKLQKYGSETTIYNKIKVAQRNGRYQL